MDKKKAVIFSAGDANNTDYAVSFWNSLTKFCDPGTLDMIYYTNETRGERLAKIPKGVKIEDITPQLADPQFWYRQKPVLSEPLLARYDLVLGMDIDQIVTGSLDYIFETDDYDVATVINWNRYDIQRYPQVDIGRVGIFPIDYFNCGLVALRSAKFAHNWKVNCFSPMFERMQYREQDILNLLCYFGNFNVRCLDHGDGVAKMSAWWGLISKGEYLRAEMAPDNQLFVPQGLGDTPFPPRDTVLKVLHAGGGNTPNKLNYKTWFKNEKIIEYLDYLVSPTIKPGEMNRKPTKIVIAKNI